MTALHDADRWLDAAACRGMDPDLFHPHRDSPRRDIDQALAVCQNCPVTTECLTDALRWGGNADQGIRGGTTALQRRRLRSKPRPAGLQPCGTDAAYQRHRRAEAS